jgi:hypothetical protein
MKGITAFMLEIFLLVLAISLFLIFLEPIRRVFASEKPSTSTPPMFSSSTTTFDYSTYLLDLRPVDIDQYDNYNSDLCKKLKNALKYAVMTGRPYKADEIAYGSDLISSVPFPFIGNCNDEILETEIANGLKQKVCNFVQINTNSPVGRDDYGGITDAAGLSFDGCFYKTFSYSSLFGDYVGFKEDLNHASDAVNLFYSPDYLYIKNGDYSHHFTSFSFPFYPPFGYITNATAFDNAYNGAGRLKIYVGDAQSKNGDCTFNIYFCPRSAIAKSIENSTISIFNLFKDFELASLKFEFRPYYITDLSDSASEMFATLHLPIGYLDITFSKKVYYWNYYDVDLDGDYDVSTILNAIKEGFYLNIKGKNYFFAQPHWDIARDVTIDKNRECWSSDYDDIIKSGSVQDRTRSIRFNCGDDNVCKRQLRIRIAIRLDNATQNIDSDDNLEELNYISGFISFCDEGTIGAYCGNNMLDGTEKCDCGVTTSCTDEGGGDTGGVTCTSLKYQSGELGCKPFGPDQCTFDTSSCVPFVCGDNTKNGFEQCDGFDFGTPTQTCTGLGYKSGTLACKPPSDPNNCTFDTSGCVPHVCGDGIKGPAEQCDGSDFGGKTCADLGYTPTCPDKCESDKEYRTGSGGGVGSLTCIAAGLPGNCTFDTSGCLACTYATVKPCMYSCSSDNLNCNVGSWCDEKTCTGRLDFGCSGSGTSCTANAKCGYSFPADYPLCTYSDTYRPWVCTYTPQWGCDPNYTCIAGWFNCCTDTTSPCVGTTCNIDASRCKYV